MSSLPTLVSKESILRLLNYKYSLKVILLQTNQIKSEQKKTQHSINLLIRSQWIPQQQLFFTTLTGNVWSEAAEFHWTVSCICCLRETLADGVGGRSCSLAGRLFTGVIKPLSVCTLLSHPAALPPFRFICPSLNCDDVPSISTSQSFDHFWFHTELPRSVSSVSPVRCLDLTCHRERRRRRLLQICHRRPGILTGHDCWWGDYACWNCRAGFWNYISAFQKEWEREKRPCRQPITWE